MCDPKQPLDTGIGFAFLLEAKNFFLHEQQLFLQLLRDLLLPLK